MNRIKFESNILKVGGKEIAFKEQIYQIKENNYKIFVLLDIPQKEEYSYDDFHNVYCYSHEGERIWQIGNRDKGDNVVYTMINVGETILYANDFMGRRYSVNKLTGEIENMEITK